MSALKMCKQLLKEQLKTKNNLSKLIKQLIYGKNLYYFNTFIQQPRSIVLYLHQTNPQILIAIDKENKDFVMYFQIKMLTINQSRYDYEQLYDIANHVYLIIQDTEDFIILLFNDPSLNQSKQQMEKYKQQCDYFYVNFKDLAYKMVNCLSQFDSTMVKNFLHADVNKDHSLSINEITNMFHQIKIQDSIIIGNIINFIKQQTKFQKFNYKDFKIISKILCCRQQLVDTFETYSSIKLREFKSYLQKAMDQEQFKKFLIEVQYEKEDTAANIVAEVFKIQKNRRISFYNFSLFMTSFANDITSDQFACKEVSKDESLLSYMCFSSNNTYLAGNELLSGFRAERYYEDLQNGIRCVDIDCFDGSDGPAVKQGQSFGRFISFQSVLRQILKFTKAYADKYNKAHTPIIISITNKCNAENQSKMASSLCNIFGDKIFHLQQCEYHDNFPTMAQLMGKIIIKSLGTIKIYEQLCSVSLKINHEKPISEKDRFDVAQAMKKENTNIQGGSIQFLMRKHKFNERKEQLQFQMRKFQQQKIKIDQFVSKSSEQHGSNLKFNAEQFNKELLKLTSIFSNGKLGEPNCWECMMLGQQKLFRYYRDQSDRRVISFQSKNGWIRTYPKQLRISNSNFNPLPAIELGIQIISLNTQNADAQTLLMKKFLEKGSKWLPGYRLRPELKHPEQLKKIVITPISAMKLYFNDAFRANQIPHCQIKMRFYCYIKDLHRNKECTQWKQYTQVIKNNAYNPIFQHNTSMILRYTEQQLGFVVVKIDNVGIGVIPLQNIRQGYRVVTLYDHRALPKLSKVMFSIIFETGKLIKK